MVSSLAASGLVLLKQLKIDWFREARSAARPQDPFLLRHDGVCRHGNHGDLAHVRFLAHPCEEVEAVFGTEIDIKQDGIGKPLGKNLELAFKSAADQTS